MTNLRFFESHPVASMTGPRPSSILASDEFLRPGPALFYPRIVHRWDARAHANITRYYRALVERPALARVIDEARPYREVFPLPWPDDADER